MMPAQELEGLRSHVVRRELLDSVLRLAEDWMPAGQGYSVFTGASEPPAVDCFAVAIALARPLGPEFSSEDPHRLANRGRWWRGER